MRTINELEEPDIPLQKELETKNIEELTKLLEELDIRTEYAERMMRNPRHNFNALQEHVLSLRRMKLAIKNLMEQKRDETRLRNNPDTLLEEETAQKNLFAYLNEISSCPYCNETFTGNPYDKEKARKRHINDKHPGRKPKEIE